MKKSNTRGVIENIYKVVDEVNWQGNRPMFIKCKFDTGVVRMCHHTQIKRVKQ